MPEKRNATPLWAALCLCGAVFFIFRNDTLRVLQ